MTARNQAGENMRSQFHNRGRNTGRNQKGLATWVKILIGVMIVGTISIIAIIGATVWFAGSAMKDMMDPVKVRATAASIAEFSDPLPKGWEFQMALGLMGMNVVVVKNTKEDCLLTFLKLPNTDSEKLTSESVITDYSAKGVPAAPGSDPSKAGAPLDIKDKGKLTVGGEEMTYAMGESQRSGKKFSQLVGCVLPKSSKSVIIVNGVCENSAEFKLDAAKTLLSSIKAFAADSSAIPAK